MVKRKVNEIKVKELNLPRGCFHISALTWILHSVLNTNFTLWLCRITTSIFLGLIFFGAIIGTIGFTINSKKMKKELQNPNSKIYNKTK